MPCAADFHDQIADACLPEAAGVVDHAAALDAAVDVLNAHATAGDPTIRGFLRARKGPATRLPGRHDDLNVVQRQCQTSQILQQAAPGGHGVGGGIGDSLIMGAAGVGVTQKEDREHRIDQQEVFARVIRFLAAITARLLNRILGAFDAPFGPIVANRGEAGGDDAPSVGSTRASASASATPRRLASSVTERAGASPSARSVARSTTKRT
jgi:hypothetical protein